MSVSRFLLAALIALGACHSAGDQDLPAPRAPGDEGCVPMSCEDLGVSCGEVDDGCSASLDCGPCDAVTECDEGELANACGGCRTLAAVPGQNCACGGAITCSGENTVQCDSEQFETIGLADTTDAVDGWTERTGQLDGHSNLPADYDTYTVYVNDVWNGILNPTFEFERSGNTPLEICVTWDPDPSLLEEFIDIGTGWSAYVECDGGLNPIDLEGDGCCQRMLGHQSSLAFDVDVLLDLPSPTDEDGTWTITVKSLLQPGETAMCEDYTLRYGF